MGVAALGVAARRGMIFFKNSELLSCRDRRRMALACTFGSEHVDMPSSSLQHNQYSRTSTTTKHTLRICSGSTQLPDPVHRYIGSNTIQLSCPVMSHSKA